MGSSIPTTLTEVPPAVRRLCLAQADVCLVPAEALSECGIEAPFADMLLSERRLTREQMACLAGGFTLYWTRCRELQARAPGSWLPPRATNLLIASRSKGILPYVEPFRGTSSLLYASDLDTHPEYVAALLVHMERLSMLRSVRATVAYNLSYWFDREEASRRAFAEAARRAVRPDAAAFVAVADAFTWIDELLHDPLRPPTHELAEPYVHITGADLYVPKRLQPNLMALSAAAEDATRSAYETTAPDTVPAAPQALDELSDWLVAQRAHVIVQGPGGETLWSPQHDDAALVRRALEEADSAAVVSIHDALRIIDERTRQFFKCVHDVDALPTRCPVLESGDGTYVDAGRRAVVYELQQPGFDTRVGAAPPYHGLLLGARVMHEWGHVAHTAKLIRVPEERRPDYLAAREEIGEAFVRVIEAMPQHFREMVDEELRSIESKREELPQALARRTLARVGDYLANLMMSRLLPGEEMQAYVRTNVTHHLDERLGLVTELARHAYEIHYLDLCGLPRSYFFATSRFPDHYFATGIAREADVQALFDAVGRALACYGFDEARISLPARAAG